MVVLGRAGLQPLKLCHADCFVYYNFFVCYIWQPHENLLSLFKTLLGLFIRSALLKENLGSFIIRFLRTVLCFLGLFDKPAA